MINRLSQAVTLLLTALFAALTIVVATPSYGQNISDQIPNLGQPANRYFSSNLQNLYGRLVYNEFYKSSAFVHDPIVDQYINELGFKIFSHVKDEHSLPRFFVINANSINAFAYPGGTIGFHTGLITETQTESELAGVMAHEISHVTQSHIARSIQNQAKQAPLQILATLATVLAAAQSDNNNAIAGALTVTQGLFAQQAISFNRGQESEADQVGLQLMEASGFNVEGFRDFFERLQRKYSDDRAAKIPELLRSHPLPRSRIAEANARITLNNSKPIENSITYEFAKAILIEKLPRDERPTIASLGHSEIGRRFHQALREYAANPNAGIKLMYTLSRDTFNENVHLKLAEMQLNNQQSDASEKTIDTALLLFPNNTPLSLFKAERLLSNNKSNAVLELLLALQEKSQHPKIPEILSKAYIKENNLPEAYFQLATHYYLIGNYYQALYQLDNALADKDLSKEQRARIKQYYERIYRELPDDLREEIIRSNRRRDRL